MTARVFQDRLGSRAVLVVHPRREQAISGLTEELPGLGALAERLETRGDRCDAGRIRDLVDACRPDVVIAAGGDGTVSEVARGLLASSEAHRPDLAILPLGTANNVARSYGLLSVRTHGKAAVERAMLAVRSDVRRNLDVGLVNGQPFVGSFALGIDAAILTRRNALRARMPLGEVLGGYPLYLASCALETLRHRGVGATLEAEGTSEQRTLYNLLVTTCAIYAGEFRFDGDEARSDDRMRAHWFDSAAQYLPAYVAAWRRHRRHETGRSIEPATGTRVWRQARLGLEEPIAGQIDGEELPPRCDWTVEVRPAAIRLRVPAEDEVDSPRATSFRP